MANEERIEQAQSELQDAVYALDGLVTMLNGMAIGATVEARSLFTLLMPIVGNVGAALDNVS